MVIGGASGISDPELKPTVGAYCSKGLRCYNAIIIFGNFTHRSHRCSRFGFQNSGMASGWYDICLGVDMISEAGEYGLDVSLDKSCLNRECQDVITSNHT